MTTTVYLLDGIGNRVPVEYLGPHRSLADRGRAAKIAPGRHARLNPGFSRVRSHGRDFPVRNDYLIVPRDDPRGSSPDGRELQGKRSPSVWGGAATPRSPG